VHPIPIKRVPSTPSKTQSPKIIKLRIFRRQAISRAQKQTPWRAGVRISEGSRNRNRIPRRAGGIWRWLELGLEGSCVRWNGDVGYEDGDEVELVGRSLEIAEARALPITIAIAR